MDSACPLRRKIILALGLVILLTVVAFAWLTHFVVTPRIREQVGASLSAMATQARASLTERLRERSWELRNSALRAALSDAVLSDAALTEAAKPRQRPRQVTSNLKATGQTFGWIGFADAMGRVVVSSDPMIEGMDVSNADWFVSGRLAPHLAEIAGSARHAVMIAAPITAADGKALGVIAARLNPSWLMAAERATLADHHPLRDGTELLLLDRHGVVIDGPAALMDAAVPFGGTDPDDRFFQVTRLGGEDYDVGRPVGTRAPELDRLGWSVVAVQPIAMAARPLTWLSIDTTVIATAAGLVLLACGWIIVSGACQPLTALGKTASRMAAGDRVPSIPTLGDYAEVRSLSHSLQALDDRMREGERRSSMIGRSLKDRDMLLRTMAHDLRSPLTAALSLAETLANPASRLDAERRVAVAAGCFQAVRNMQDMLDNLLRWTFLTMEVAPVSTPVDIRQLIHDSLAMSFATAEMKSVDLIVEVPPLTVEADPDMIGTIVRNLVNNAVKFTREGGVVRVTARMADGGMTLTVSDTGVGMGARTIAALFAEGSSHAILPTTPGTDGEPGTGLGLMLCRDLVERCGGRIAVESVEGSGTAFQVFLPVRPASSGSERRYPTA